MTTVREPTAHLQLARWYEDLRAQATGQVPASTPRGLTLFLHSGLPAWMVACPPVTPDPAPARAVSSASATPARALAGMSPELVGVLTEMALGSLRRCRL